MIDSVSRREALRTIAVGVLAASQACVFRRGNTDVEDDSVINLRVVNHNVLDITVYSLRGTTRDRVGLVTANTSSTFKVRMRQLGTGGDLRLYADPIGQRNGYTSETVHVFAGQSVDWTLETDLRRSFLAVRD